MNNYLISQSKPARLEWSGFAGCFPQAQWQTVHAVWGPDGTLVSLWMAVCGHTAPWC